MNKRFSSSSKQLRAKGKAVALKAFINAVNSGRLAVNMQIGTLADFLKTGVYSNIYEFSEQLARKNGTTKDQVLREKLGPWYKPRLDIDAELGMRDDTHYAMQNVGGLGPERYGPCCVLLSSYLLAPFGTAFSGDSIKTVFDNAQRRVLSKAEILDRFSIANDFVKSAVVAHEPLIERSPHGISISMLREHLESGDTLIEFHVHGPIKVSDVEEIRMKSAAYERYWELLKESRGLPRPRAMKYDEADAFARLVLNAERAGIPINSW